MNDRIVKMVKTKLRLARNRWMAILPLNKEIGRWTIIGHPKCRLYCGYKFWFVKAICDCGTVKMVECFSLKKATSVSCGCYKNEVATTHGFSHTRMYRRWNTMRNRCYRKEADGYEDYGGRGITVCDEWRHDFSAFMEWALKNGWNEDLEIDRKDNNGPYSPSNCRFVTRVVNSRNTRRNRNLEAFGETKVIAAWVEDKRCVVGYNTFSTRIGRGWPTEQALTLPIRPRGRNA